MSFGQRNSGLEYFWFFVSKGAYRHVQLPWNQCLTWRRKVSIRIASYVQLMGSRHCMPVSAVDPKRMGDKRLFL